MAQLLERVDVEHMARVLEARRVQDAERLVLWALAIRAWFPRSLETLLAARELAERELGQSVGRGSFTRRAWLDSFVEAVARRAKQEERALFVVLEESIKRAKDVLWHDAQRASWRTALGLVPGGKR